MDMNKLLERALAGLDDIGYRLDSLGITSKVNRHTVIAYLMNEQKYFEGEVDSLKARFGSRKFQLERTFNRVESFAMGSVDRVLQPARSTVASVRGILKV